MSLKRSLFGNNLNKAGIGIQLVMYFFLAATAYGFWADFVPSEYQLNFGKHIPYLLSAFLSILLAWATFTGRWKMKTSNLYMKIGLLTIFSPILIFGCVWFSLNHGIPACYTRLFGNDTEMVLALEKYRSSSRHACTYQLRGRSIKTAFPSHICISENYYLQEPKEVSVTLKVKLSALGFYVIHVFDNTPNKVLTSDAREWAPYVLSFRHLSS